MAEEKSINVLENIWSNIKKGVELGKTLIMLQGSARSGKTFNTLIYIIVECLSNPVRHRKILDPVSMKHIELDEPLRVSIVRQSLPVIKRSVYRDFKDIMMSMGQWNDRCMNKTDWTYTFPNGAMVEFFSADDEQKLRGPSRHILYINEANEISYYSFSMLRMRTYEYVIADYNPTFTEDHWLFPLIKDNRTYHFISTYRDNIFLPKAAVEEIESYKETNPGMWEVFGLGKFAIIEGLVFPRENWDIIPDEDFPSWAHEGYIGLDWGFDPDPTVALHVIIEGDDVYVKEVLRETKLLSKDIAKELEPYRGIIKHCDIDKRLVAELDMAGIPLLNKTLKNGESILTGIHLINQRKIHITESSTDLIKEFRNYVYKKGPGDQYLTDENPIDKFSHGPDALRYVMLAEFGESYTKPEKELTKADLGLFM